MVGSLAHPLNIFILGFGGGFLLPLLNRLGKRWVFAAFVSALAAMAAISAVCAVQLYHGAEPIEITTGGSIPPYSINLRMGLAEALSATSVGLLGLLGALYFVREKYAVMLLYLLIIMGIQGMVMTRDLFNLFVFLEIVSIATYGLLSSALFGGSIGRVQIRHGDRRRFDVLSARHDVPVRGERHVEHRRVDRQPRRHHRADRLRRTDASARVPAARAETLPCERLGSRCLSDGAGSRRRSRRLRGLGRGLLCPLQSLPTIRALRGGHRRARRVDLRRLEPDRA